MNPATAYSQALTITRDLDGALGAIRDAQARLPVLPELLMQEGGVFFLAHRFEKMEAVGRELLTVDPEHTSRRWLVGLSLELRGRVREAIGEYETAVRASARDDTRVLCALLHAYGMAGDRKKALDTLHRILPDLKGASHAVHPCLLRGAYVCEYRSARGGVHVAGDGSADARYLVPVLSFGRSV